MSTATIHTDVDGIEEGRTYRSLRMPTWKYRVAKIFKECGTLYCEYVVIGGSEDGARGKILMSEFAERIR